MYADFVKCVNDQLKSQGFGEKRRDEIIDNFNGLIKGFEAQGHSSEKSATMAMTAVFKDLEDKAAARQKSKLKLIEVQAETKARAQDGGANIKAKTWFGDGGRGPGGGVARGLTDMIEFDGRATGGQTNAIAKQAGLLGRYHAMMATALDYFGKGAFGTQRNKIHLRELEDALWDIKSTSNPDIKATVEAWQKTTSATVNDFNNAGGSLREKANWRIPQKMNPAKLPMFKDIGSWVDVMLKRSDWDNMRMPNGAPIPEKARIKLLKDIYPVIKTNGGAKIDPADFNGMGREMGNLLEQHRFFEYKTADDWRAVKELYGADGNVIDIMFHHLDNMAHKTAAVDTFGTNPDMWFKNAEATGKQVAADIAAKATTKLEERASIEFENALKNRVKPMFEQYMGYNYMNPDTYLSSYGMAVSNTLVSVQLGSIPFLSVMGDFMTSISNRILRNTQLTGGMETYFKSMTYDYKNMQKIFVREGLISDSLTASTYNTQRYSPIATYGPEWSKKLADWTMRANLNNRHTESARIAVRKSLMAMMHDYMPTKYDELPFKDMLKQYGIGEAEWDVVRKNVTPSTPQQGLNLLSPMAIYNSKLVNKDDLYDRFFNLIYQEGLNEVPGATLEASITMKGAMRPDTLPGLMLHSFAMYKNFPVAVWQKYARLAQNEENTGKRLAFLGALGVGAIINGAVGVQLRELAKGREPLSMNTVAFWAKAGLSGGALGIWGDYLFAGVNEYGHGPEEAIAGPLGGLLKDSTELLFGSPFKFVDAWDKDTEYKNNWAAAGARFVKSYAPGTSMWWARLGLEREVWDRLEEMADPNAYKKRQSTMRKREREFGQGYWSEPGERLFTGR